MALITGMKGGDGEDSESKVPSRTIDDGPPTSTTKPKKVEPKGSLFVQSTGGMQDQNSQGLGPEGGDPQILINQALGRLLIEVKTLSALAPGVVPILSDLVGRLQMVLPQVAQDIGNGGMGLIPMGGMPLPQPGMAGPAGMPPPGMPPPMGPPGMQPPMPQAPPPMM